MEALFILMGLLMMSNAYNYDDNKDFHPRYGFHTRSRTQFGRTLFRKMQFSRASFRTSQFRRPPFLNRFQPQLYGDKYLRERSAYPSVSPWLRKNNPISVIPTEIPKNPNASLSIFGVLKTEQNNAKLLDETKNLWIARVVTTPEGAAPVVCSAACIEERIFVTASTCLLNAKVYYTRVHYQDVALQPLAFVLPSKPTKAMFNDVGLIVVNRNFTKPWQIKQVYYTTYGGPKYEDTFVFMTTLGKGWWTTRIVGYVAERDFSPNEPNNTVYSLYELDTWSSPYLCNYLYNKHPPSDTYFVPCYSACTLEEYSQNMSKCYNYLAGEGHLVLCSGSFLLMGIATWGGHYKTGLNKPPLPVGFATVNSFAFLEDLECARNIAKAPDASERFDNLCQ